jgi:iron complex transport system permease protein
MSLGRWTARPVTARRLALLGGVLSAVVMVVGLACTAAGPYPVFSEEGWGFWQSRLWQARLLRMVAAVVVGGGLAAGGVALQGMLLNPLAEPYILGISSGAGVGVLAGLAAAGSAALPGWATTPVLAFAGAVASCTAVYLIAQRRGQLDRYTLILAGVIVNTFNAAIMLAMYMYVDPYRIADFARWSMGQLPDIVDLQQLGVCGACVGVGWLVVLARSAGLNVMGLGDAVARSAGVSVGRLRIEIFAAVGLMTAAAVALAGPIGFVGLIVPHLARLVLGADHRRLAVAATLGGGLFLMLAETLCVSAGGALGVSRLPVGVVTALCGGPFFIVLLRRRGAQAR